MDIILRGVRVRPLSPPRSIGAAIDRRFGHRRIPVALPGVDDPSTFALIGGFPNADGDAYAELFETIDGAMPFPGWEPFEGRTE